MTGPQLSSISARAFSAVFNPQARRMNGRTLLFGPLWRPSASPRLIAARMPSRCFRMGLPTFTNCGIRHRCVHEHHQASIAIVSSSSRSPAKAAQGFLEFVGPDQGAAPTLEVFDVESFLSVQVSASFNRAQRAPRYVFAISALASVTYYVGITYVPVYLTTVSGYGERWSLGPTTITPVAVVVVTPIVGARCPTGSVGDQP